MKLDNLFIFIASVLLVATATARTLKNAYEKKVTGKLGIAMSLSVNIIGGVMLGLLVSIYTDEPRWQMLAASVGAWSGEKSLDFITDIIQEKLNIKDKNDGTDKQQ